MPAIKTASGLQIEELVVGTGATAAIWLHKELSPDHLCLSGRDW